MLAAGWCALFAAALPALATDPPATAPAGPTATQPAKLPLFFGPMRPPTPYQIKTVLAFAREHLPEQYERLNRLLSEDPSRAGPMVHRLYQLYVGVRRFPPEVRKAAIRRHQASGAIYWTVRELRRSGDPVERERLAARLRELITRQFDCEQIVKEYEVKRYAQRVAALTEAVERLRTDREKVIAERIERLLAPRPRSRPTTRPRRHARRLLTPEQIAEVTAFTRQHMPELHERLERLRKDNPRRAGSLLRRLRRLVAQAKRYPTKVRQAAIARHKLNIPISATVRQIRRSDEPAEKDKLKKQLRELLAQQFDHDQIVKQFEAELLKQQLAEAKAEVGRRRRDRQRIITARLKRLSAPRPARSKPTDTATLQK